MRPELDPSEMTPGEHRYVVAEILSMGLRRLRDCAALATSDNSENPGEPGREAVPANPLTVHAV